MFRKVNSSFHCALCGTEIASYQDLIDHLNTAHSQLTKQMEEIKSTMIKNYINSRNSTVRSSIPSKAEGENPQPVSVVDFKVRINKILSAHPTVPKSMISSILAKDSVEGVIEYIAKISNETIKRILKSNGIDIDAMSVSRNISPWKKNENPFHSTMLLARNLDTESVILADFKNRIKAILSGQPLVRSDFFSSIDKINNLKNVKEYIRKNASGIVLEILKSNGIDLYIVPQDNTRLSNEKKSGIVPKKSRAPKVKSDPLLDFKDKIKEVFDRHSTIPKSVVSLILKMDNLNSIKEYIRNNSSDAFLKVLESQGVNLESETHRQLKSTGRKNNKVNKKTALAKSASSGQKFNTLSNFKGKIKEVCDKYPTISKSVVSSVLKMNNIDGIKEYIRNNSSDAFLQVLKSNGVNLKLKIERKLGAKSPKKKGKDVVSKKSRSSERKEKALSHFKNKLKSAYGRHPIIPENVVLSALRRDNLNSIKRYIKNKSSESFLQILKSEGVNLEFDVHRKRRASKFKEKKKTTVRKKPKWRSVWLIYTPMGNKR